MTDALTFYTNPMSRGRIVRWMLEETGARYATCILGYDGDMRAPDYLAINPMGKVPAIRHGDHVVTESAAICAYLADAFPQAGLAPPPAQRADYYRWLFFAAGPLEHAITNQALGVVPSDDRRRMVGYGSFETAVDVLDAALTGRTYVCDHGFTAADVYVGAQIGFGLRFATLPRRDSFVAYDARLNAREACQRAMAMDDALMPDNTPAGDGS